MLTNINDSTVYQKQLEDTTNLMHRETQDSASSSQNNEFKRQFLPDNNGIASETAKLAKNAKARRVRQMSHSRK